MLVSGVNLFLQAIRFRKFDMLNGARITDPFLPNSPVLVCLAALFKKACPCSSGAFYSDLTTRQPFPEVSFRRAVRALV